MTAKELYEWAIRNDCTEAELKVIIKDSVYDWDTQKHYEKYIEPCQLDVRMNIKIENCKGTLKPKLVEEIEITIEN